MMADAGDIPMLSRIFDQLAAIERTLEVVRDDVVTLKAERKGNEATANDVKDLTKRVHDLEITRASAGGAVGVGGKALAWIASLASALIAAAIVAAVALALRR